MVFKDKQAQLAYQRKWYAENREKTKAKTISRRTQRKQWFREIQRTVCCVSCSENHPVCLDFHHIHGDKRVHVTDMVKRTFSECEILAEIKKCIPLCVNCHRKLPARRITNAVQTT